MAKVKEIPNISYKLPKASTAKMIFRPQTKNKKKKKRREEREEEESQGNEMPHTVLAWGIRRRR